MNKIQDAVNGLRQSPGVRGTAVVTTDGLIAASALDPSLGVDVIAGMTSYLMMTTNKGLAEGGLGTCGRLTLTATHGKAVFVDLGESCLVVLFDQFADVNAVRKDIDQAAARIRQSSRLS
jgi:predicted regulator of Ras-like GTPase activity (Roadblock/LC7/MglB family)